MWVLLIVLQSTVAYYAKNMVLVGTQLYFTSLEQVTKKTKLQQYQIRIKNTSFTHTMVPGLSKLLKSITKANTSLPTV